jgi:hypothetical protein
MRRVTLWLEFQIRDCTVLDGTTPPGTARFSHARV